MYLDFNSICASAMVQALPTGEIKVCYTDNYTSSSVSNSTSAGASTCSSIGYIYTIDVKYSKELEQKTEKYSFFPE